ncbi:MAG TPA: hypothetical protein VF527_08660 [Pyrinomonadaceae bacterium]|jgi:hypothetical protein
MSWISLAASRYELREGLRINYEDAGHQAHRFDKLSSLIGLYAMLAGDDFYVKREIERAQILLRDHRDYIHPPNHVLMGEVLSLAVIASLGDMDCSDIFQSIAKMKKYKGKGEKSLQLLARRIAGLEETPNKPSRKRGHVKGEAQWYRFVEKAAPADAFNLAVTPEHPHYSLFQNYVLPLAYLVAFERAGADWRDYLLRLSKWGGSDPGAGRNIVYERTSTAPSVEVKVKPGNKATWRGFDAVELKGEEVFAYYYLGVTWQAPLFFEEDINIYLFLDNVEFDWHLVEEAVATEQWRTLAAAKEQGRCSYVFVYDAAQITAPEDDLARAEEHYGLNIIARDISEA